MWLLTAPHRCCQMLLQWLVGVLPAGPMARRPAPACKQASRSAPCSAPAMSNVEMVGPSLYDFRMVVTPQTSSPYISYPPGGFTHWIVTCDFNAVQSNGSCM